MPSTNLQKIDRDSRNIIWLFFGGPGMNVFIPTYTSVIAKPYRKVSQMLTVGCLKFWISEVVFMAGGAEKRGLTIIVLIVQVPAIPCYGTTEM